jgi:hypothetical protein
VDSGQYVALLHFFLMISKTVYQHAQNYFLILPYQPAFKNVLTNLAEDCYRTAHKM